VRVTSSEVAQVLREAMTDVVANGTARRVAGAFTSPDGTLLTVGGKTGTGDNRYRTFSSGGRLLESRSVNRTSTFVFFVGDRFYGVVTAYVPGEDADDYTFTSALPSQILRELAPMVNELVRNAEVDPPQDDLSSPLAEEAGEPVLPSEGEDPVLDSSPDSDLSPPLSEQSEESPALPETLPDDLEPQGALEPIGI